MFFFETNTGAATLAKYRTFKSIRRNLFTEAIRPQRDLKPFITPLMTSQCQHAEFTRWQGHLHLLVLSITFQCVTHIFAPFLPQGHFSLLTSNGFAHLTFFFFYHIARPTVAQLCDCVRWQVWYHTDHLRQVEPQGLARHWRAKIEALCTFATYRVKGSCGCTVPGLLVHF